MEQTCLLTPTAGRHYRIDEMLEDPIALNTRLGYYTNFVNLFDMSAVSVPVGLTKSKKPFGVTLSNKSFVIAPYFQLPIYLRKFSRLRSEQAA